MKVFCTCAALVALLLVSASLASAQTRVPGAVEWGAPIPAQITVLPLGFTGDDAAFFQANIVNPASVEFTPSVDHNVIENTVAVLTRYDLEIYTPTGTVPVKTVDLGKPTPNGANLIIYAGLRAALVTVAPGDYVAKVASVGSGGTSRSVASNPFTVALRSPVAPPSAPILR